MMQQYPTYRVTEPQITPQQYLQYNEPYYLPNQPFPYSQLPYPYSQEQHNEMERYSIVGSVLGKVGYNEAKSLLQNTFISMINPITEKVALSIAQKLKGEINDIVKDSVTGLIKDLISAQTDQTKAFSECIRSVKNVAIEENERNLMQSIDDTGLHDQSTYHGTDLLVY